MGKFDHNAYHKALLHAKAQIKRAVPSGTALFLIVLFDCGVLRGGK